MKLRTLLSESAGFRSLTDSEDAAEALEFVHYGYAEDVAYKPFSAPQSVKVLPRALVALEDYSSEKSTAGSYLTTALLSLKLEAETPEDQKSLSMGDRYFWWLGQCETIVDDLRELTADQTRLLIETYDIAVPPHRTSPDDTENEEWMAVFTMEVQT